jgi:hypothetical protein
MKQEDYYKILDELTDWFMGSDAQLVAEPIKDRKHQGKYDRSPPEKGHPVVRSFKVKDTPCSWCGDNTHQVKFYTRNPNSNTWTAKCKQQGCRRKLKLHTSQIGQESSIISCIIDENSK